MTQGNPFFFGEAAGVWKRYRGARSEVVEVLIEVVLVNCSSVL
jgi:hypothetical protein